MSDGPSMTLDSYLGQLVGESHNWIDKRSGESVAGILASIDGVRGIVDALKAERDALRARVAELKAGLVQKQSTIDALRARVKQLEHGYDELRTVCNRQQHQLAAAQRVPEDAELDAIVVNLRLVASAITEDQESDEVARLWSSIDASAADAITALRRQVAEAIAQRDTACELAGRIVNQRRERCPTCFGDVRGGRDAE